VAHEFLHNRGTDASVLHETRRRLPKTVKGEVVLPASRIAPKTIGFFLMEERGETSLTDAIRL